jgi:hypothetical protein
MSRLLWALALGLALGGPPLQSWAAGLFEAAQAPSAGTDAGSIFDPNGGAIPDAGNQFDPNGGASTDAGSQFDPDG